MNTTEIKDWLILANMALSVGAIIYAWLTSQASAAIKRVGDLEQHVDAVDRRLANVENDIQHMPSASVAHRLELAVGDIKGEMAVLAERLKPVAAISDRLQEFLLEQAKR